MHRKRFMRFLPVVAMAGVVLGAIALVVGSSMGKNARSTNDNAQAALPGKSVTGRVAEVNADASIFTLEVLSRDQTGQVPPGSRWTVRTYQGEGGTQNIPDKLKEKLQSVKLQKLVITCGRQSPEGTTAILPCGEIIKKGALVLVSYIVARPEKSLLLARAVTQVSDVPNPTAPTPPATPNAPSLTPAPLSGNPFGVMLGGAGMTDEKKAQYAKTLGAAMMRPAAVFVESWNGSCSECDAAGRYGLKLVLTVRNNGGKQKATTPPKDLASYKRTIGAILDAYHPQVLVVENEENSKELFFAGTPAQYHEELAAACEVTHQKGLKCANGGLVSTLVAFLVADSYQRTGDVDRARDFLNRTVAGKLEGRMGGSTDPLTILKSRQAAQLISRGKQLLAGYKAAGADYVNFHWYIADTKALEEAVAYLTTTSGLPAITNEVGQQKNEDPGQVTAVMGKILELPLPVAIWFSVDVPGMGEAKSLIDANGTLRPNGAAYQQVIKSKGW